jgi:branched-chain amino acid transport system permease protein
VTMGRRPTYINPRTTLAGIIVVTLVLAVAPLWLSPGVLRQIAEIFFVFAMAQSWNLLAGFVGLLSIGHQGFVGLGAYSLFVISNKLGISPHIATFLAFFFCALAAAGIAPFLFRLRDAYFSIGIWVLAEIVRTAVAKSQWLGGSTGLVLDAARTMDRYWLSIGIYWWSVALAMGSIALLFLLVRSRLGLALMAVRDNDLTAASVGIDVGRARFIAFVLSAATCGVAGAAYSMWAYHIDPNGAFDVNWVVVMLFITIIGGIGTIEGPIVGTAIYFGLRAALGDVGNWYLILMGGAAVVAMIAWRKGIWGSLSSRFGFELFSVRRFPPS